MLIRSIAVIVAKLVFAAFAVFAFSAAAEAASYLTFVSNTGVDTRPCTVEAQPCKTMPRAVAVTSAGGTIRILSDLTGQPIFSIAKSLTVEGGGNSMIGAIAISNASAVVILRGLHLTGVGVLAHAIIINTAAAVHIENCTIERYTGDGIEFIASTATKLFVSDTVVRANGSDGLYVDAVNAKVVIQDSRFEQNYSSGVYLKVAKASVTGSDASGNGQNGFVLRSYLAGITETTADNNVGNGFTVGVGLVRLNSARATNNSGRGLYTETDGYAYISDCTFEGNTTGISNDGAVITYGDNRIGNLSGNGLTTGSLN